MLLDRVCRNNKCNKNFIGGPRAYYCPECRVVRRRDQSTEGKRRKKKGLVREWGSIDFCERCGKEFIVNAGLQRYCPECQPIHAKEYDRITSLETYHNNSAKINKSRLEARILQRAEETAAIKNSIPQLIGKHELFMIFGVKSYQTIKSYIRNPDFPVPLQELQGGPIWIQSEIEDYDNLRQWKPGIVHQLDQDRKGVSANKKPNIPPLAGKHELFEIFGVKSLTTIKTYIGNPDFPTPLQELQGGPIWLRSELEAYKIILNRRKQQIFKERGRKRKGKRFTISDKDLTGMVFGRLTVIGVSEKRLTNAPSKRFWKCKCECGEMTDAEASNLRRGKVSSCGCLRSEIAKVKGQNLGNLKRRRGTNTGIPGVSKLKTGRYLAFVVEEGKQRVLGTCTDEEEAIRKIKRFHNVKK